MKNKKMISIGMFFVVFFCSTIFSFAETRTLLTKNGGEVNLFEKTEKIEKTVKKIDGTAQQTVTSNLSPEQKKIGDNKLIADNSNIITCSDLGEDAYNIINTDFLLKPSDVSEHFINNRLQGTALEGLGGAFKRAEEKYGVNALFLVSLAMHESNVGRSRIARDKNNLFGFQAYDRSPYSSAGRFMSREACIDHVAGYISRNYLSPSGKYFHGYSIESMNVCYATDKNWSQGIKARLNQLLLTY